jgi:hypothetical protein
MAQHVSFLIVGCSSGQEIPLLFMDPEESTIFTRPYHLNQDESGLHTQFLTFPLILSSHGHSVTSEHKFETKSCKNMRSGFAMSIYSCVPTSELLNGFS